ncbi:hypothetical protein GCM10009555_005900 [Acrocarpospora macrocephala]|uniref:Uncharacterized protein n=1 Tax=Acrocarpospora macrocephala TaxID=150177 RepID=A0A5M3X7E2_9ACTN|nr:hypothetical protein [Acrocarpospora macrocephala]GES14783.1 hypothetical protein Amac_083800 [Acrocarpospora macrocephala]
MHFYGTHSVDIDGGTGRYVPRSYLCSTEPRSGRNPASRTQKGVLMEIAR